MKFKKGDRVKYLHYNLGGKRMPEKDETGTVTRINGMQLWAEWDKEPDQESWIDLKTESHTIRHLTKLELVLK